MYLPRIFVSRSTAARSSPWRSRASRRLLPISNTEPDCRCLFEVSEQRVEAERERAHQAEVEAGPAEPFADPQRAFVRVDRAAELAPRPSAGGQPCRGPAH